jgi:hypothetical protein
VVLTPSIFILFFICLLWEYIKEGGREGEQMAMSDGGTWSGWGMNKVVVS